MELYQAAIEKLDQELEKENNSYLLCVNQIVRFLLMQEDEMLKNDYSDMVLQEDKNLKGAYAAMKFIAKEKYIQSKSKAAVCIDPEEAKDIVGRYFRFWGDPIIIPKPKMKQSSINYPKVINTEDNATISKNKIDIIEDSLF